MGVDSIQEGVRESRLAANRVFGVPLHLLATGDGKVPLVVDRLITTIEMYGLYTEGIYRKSGVSRNQIDWRPHIEKGAISGLMRALRFLGTRSLNRAAFPPISLECL